MTLRVVVLTCDWMGVETAQALEGAEGVSVVGVFSSPPLRPKRFTRRLRRAWQRQGPTDILRAMLRRLTRRRAAPPAPPDERPGIILRAFDNLHSPECLEAVRSLAPDLGVIDGTYILKPSVFDLPRLGSINLHCGQAPQYRGAPPVFWELYNGERQVGVTIHRVTSGVDEGTILQQEVFPLNPAPSGDVMEHTRQVWRTVLRPNGLRMLRDVVRAIATGSATEQPQDHSKGRTYRFPMWQDVRELRRRVARRRGTR